MRAFVRHASAFVPSMFIAQDPQMPSLRTHTGTSALWSDANTSPAMSASHTSCSAFEPVTVQTPSSFVKHADSVPALEKTCLADLWHASMGQALPARPPEVKRVVLLVLDLNQDVQHHRPAATRELETVSDERRNHTSFRSTRGVRPSKCCERGTDA